MGGRLGLADGLLDLDAGMVFRSGNHEVLTEQELALLRFLAQRGESTASRAQIHRQVFGYLGNTRSRAADHAIKRLRKKLELDPRAPRHLLTVKGQGYRLCTAGGSLASAPIIGRRQELQQAVERLQQRSVVAITGIGGIGKTTLALAIAAIWQGTSTWIHVAGAHDLDDLIAAIGASTSISPASQRAIEAASTLARELADCVVVLDECEGCIDAVADLTTMWSLCPTPPRVLLTSRRVPPGFARDAIPLGPLVEADALELVGRHRPDVPLEDGLALVRAVGGHPQAIEIALRVGASAAHTEIGEVVRWAWGSLTPAERTVLAAACLFPRGATIPLLARLLRDDVALAQPLRRLFEMSLVRRISDENTVDVRIAAPETVRRFVRESDEIRVLVDPFVAAMDELAGHAGEQLRGREWLQGWETLRLHHLELREAVHLAASRGDPAAVRIGMNLTAVEQEFATREAQGRLWDEVAALLPTGDDALDDRAAIIASLCRRMWGSRPAPWSRSDVVRRAAQRGDVEAEVLAIEACSFERGHTASWKDELLARATGLAEDSLPADLLARVHMARSMLLRHRGELQQAMVSNDIAAKLVQTEAGELRYIRLHAGLLQVDVGQPEAAVVALAEAANEPWSRTFRLSRAILRSAEAWALAQTDSARALGRFTEAEHDLGVLSESNEVVVRHRIWAALAAVDAGCGSALPAVTEAQARSRNLCGLSVLWCLQGRRGRAADALRRALDSSDSVHDRGWLQVSLALCTGASLPAVTHDDPVLTWLVTAFGKDARARAGAGRWRRRSIWLRVWHRAAAPRDGQNCW